MSSPFRSDQKYMYCDCDRMDFYIPEYYFDQGKRFAEDLGQSIKVFGLFNVAYYDKKVKHIGCLNCPFFIVIYDYDSEIADIDLPGDGLTSCRVVHYLKGQKVMESAIIEDGDNATVYVNFINSGKVPHTVPYSAAPRIWTKNQELSNVNFGIRSETEEMILALTYRNPKNPAEKFAIRYGSDLSVEEHEYINASVREICRQSSTFASITFEDIDSMITTSLNRTRTHGKESFTPVEDIIKM